jgi:hypothetical protein
MTSFFFFSQVVHWFFRHLVWVGRGGRGGEGAHLNVVCCRMIWSKSFFSILFSTEKKANFSFAKMSSRCYQDGWGSGGGVGWGGVGVGGGEEETKVIFWNTTQIFFSPTLTYLLVSKDPPPHQPHVTKTPFTQARFSPSPLSVCQIRSTSSLMVRSMTSVAASTRRQHDKQPKLDVL